MSQMILKPGHAQVHFVAVGYRARVRRRFEAAQLTAIAEHVEVSHSGPGMCRRFLSWERHDRYREHAAKRRIRRSERAHGTTRGRDGTHHEIRTINRYREQTRHYMPDECSTVGPAPNETKMTGRRRRRRRRVRSTTDSAFQERSNGDMPHATTADVV